MPRATKGAARRQSKKRWFAKAKGNRGARRTQWRRVQEAVVKGGTYAYRDRRTVKRDYRALWITRISAAAQERGMQYSRLMNGLKLASIALNRKMLSEIAIHDPETFDKLVEQAKAALEAKQAA
ncbi:MAG: 50S ribosomal protein L20 [Planctomycetota bacterium]